MMKTVSLLLGTLFIGGPAVQSQQPPRSGAVQIDILESTKTHGINVKVHKIGKGEQSRIKAQLSDGTEVKGYISAIGMVSFDVTDKKTGLTRTIDYADVEKIRGLGLFFGMFHHSQT
jgi:hypothetical protein